MARKSARFVEHHERTALGLIEAVSPLAGIIAAADDPTEFLYRGAGSAQFRLTPAAFRGRGAPFPDQRRVGRRTYETQLWAEHECLLQFCQIADARGLRVPEDSQQFRDILESCGDDDYRTEVAKGQKAWPPEELLSALALAQHYGIPTRLLDFTSNPYVAAYFAATSALRLGKRGNAAIWAINAAHFMLQDYASDWLRRRVRVVAAPGADIPNLQAQQGRFLLVRETEFRRSAQFRGDPYDDVLIPQLSFDSSGPVLFRFTFPAKEAGEALRLLSRLGIDGSTIFPGHVGAAQAVTERKLWPPPGSGYEARAIRFARQRQQGKWKRFAG